MSNPVENDITDTMLWSKKRRNYKYITWINVIYWYKSSTNIDKYLNIRDHWIIVEYVKYIQVESQLTGFCVT